MPITIKDINGIIERLKNNQHKKDAAEYIRIRQEVDESVINTLKSDAIAITHLSRFLGKKPFEKATRDDIRDFSNWLLKQITAKKTTMQGSTRDLYLTRIKRFYKYIAEKDKYQNGKADQKDIKYCDAVRWIAYNSHDTDELPLESLLTDKQIKKLLDGCEDIRQRVIVVSLLDAGLRASELRALKYGNVGFDAKLGYNFILPKKQKGKGTLKTGARKIQLFLIPSSSLYIKQYMNEHIYRDDPEAPFIYSMDVRRKWKKQPLTEKGLHEIFNPIVKRSGLNVHLTPHILRHNSATRCAAKGFNESMMRERYGWKKNSAMPSRYIHLAQTDIDDKIKQILGIKTEETPELSILQPITCPNCDYENVPTNVVCGRCGMKLNVTKEDLGLSASSLGVILQKAQEENPELRDTIKEELLKYLEHLLTKHEKQINGKGGQK